MDFPFVTCVSVTMSNVAVNALERISLWTGVLWDGVSFPKFCDNLPFYYQDLKKSFPLDPT